MSTVMGPQYKLTQADIAINYYLVLGAGERWSNDHIKDYLNAFDKAYGGLVPQRHSENAFWQLRRRAREILLTPLRQQYDNQRRLWYTGAHGTANDIIMLEFKTCPDRLLSTSEVDVWSCLHAFTFHCTPLPKMRLNPQLTILAHFLWGSRTTLLQYWRERSEDELADSLPGSYNMPYKYIQSLAVLCRAGPIRHIRPWRRLLDILTAHDMAHAFRNGERRAWLFFTVKFLEGVDADSNVRDAAIQDLEMAADLSAERLLHLGAQLVAVSRHFAHQLPWGPDYEEACALLNRKPVPGFRLPYCEGEDLGRSFAAWYYRVRERVKANQSVQEWSTEDLIALFTEYLSEASEVFAKGTPEFLPRPLWLRDRRVIRAETDAALKNLEMVDEEKNANGNEAVDEDETPHATPDVTPHATPLLSATEAAPLPESAEFDLDSRRMSPDEMLVLQLNNEGEDNTQKEKDQKEKAEKAADPSRKVAGVSSKLGDVLANYVHSTRTWEPKVQEQVNVWRAEHGYEYSVPRIPEAAFNMIKDDVVLKGAEALVNDLRLGYEINAIMRNPPAATPAAEDEEKKGDSDDDAVVIIGDTGAIEGTETLSNENDQPTDDSVQDDVVVTILSEEEYEALAIGDVSDTFRRPTSTDHDIAVDTSGNPTTIDIDEDPFAFHGGVSIPEIVVVPPTPRPSHLPPPPGFEPIAMNDSSRLSVLMPTANNLQELDNATLSAAYDALAQHATLVDSKSDSDSSDSDSDSDEGWGDAEIFYTAPVSASSEDSNAEVLEPISREGAISRAGHRDEENSGKSSEIASSANGKFDDYPLSDGEDEEPAKGKKKHVDAVADKKEAGEKQSFEQATNSPAESKPDPWTDPFGYARWKAATSGGASKLTGRKTPATSVGLGSRVSIKTGIGPTLLSDDDFMVTIKDLSPANSKGASPGASANGQSQRPSRADSMTQEELEQLARCIPNGERYLSGYRGVVSIARRRSGGK